MTQCNNGKHQQAYIYMYNLHRWRWQQQLKHQQRRRRRRRHHHDKHKNIILNDKMGDRRCFVLTVAESEVLCVRVFDVHRGAESSACVCVHWTESECWLLTRQHAICMPDLVFIIASYVRAYLCQSIERTPFCYSTSAMCWWRASSNQCGSSSIPHGLGTRTGWKMKTKTHHNCHVRYFLF